MSEDNKMADVLKGLGDIRAIAEKSGSDSAENKEQIKKIGEEMTAKLADIQAKHVEAETERKKVQSEVDMVKKDYEELYKKANRLGVSSTGLDAFAQVHDKYKGEFSKYLRKGVTPSSEAVEEVASAFVQRAIDSQDERAIKNAAYDMVSEQGAEQGKGFYIFGSTKTMVSGSNPDGGYLVRPDQRTDVTVSRIFETSPMRAVANIITTGTNEVEILIDDNEAASGGWVGEVTAPSNTATAQIGLLKIPVHQQIAQPQVTQIMLDDAFINIEAWISSKTNDILIRTENTAFISGNGSQKPKGILSYSNWAAAGTYERNKIEQIASGTAGAVTPDGLRNLQGSMVEAYQPRAVFLMKRDTFTDVSLLKDGAGRYLLSERMMADGVDIRLLGKPVYFADDMQAVAADSLSIAYGDFGAGYTIVDRMGIRVLRDPYTATPYVKFKTTKRVGGAVTNFQAIKIQKLAATV